MAYLLLKKVQAHGVCGKAYSWIENWLMDRKQRVKINSAYPGWNKVTSGVPQGSILGPTLFLLYINDIEKKLNSTGLKFADDTNAMKVIDNHHCHADLQNDIKGLEKWAKSWQMQFNVDKCKMMHFGRSKRVQPTRGWTVAASTQHKLYSLLLPPAMGARFYRFFTEADSPQ